MISRARPLCVFTNAISDEHVGTQILVPLEQLDRAQNRLERVVELVRDAGHEQADGGEPLLPDDLALQRLQHLVHLALLLELAIERVTGFAKPRGHVGERVLHLGELEIGRGIAGRRRQIAVGDPLRGVSQPFQVAHEQPRQPQREKQDQEVDDGDDRQVASKQRRGPRQHFAARDGHAQQPGTAIDDRVAVKALDAVDLPLQKGPGHFLRLPRRTELRADELLAVAASRHDASVPIDERDNRIGRQREVRKEPLESLEIQADAENALDGGSVTAGAGAIRHRIRQQDGLPAGDRADRELAHRGTPGGEHLEHDRRRRRLCGRSFDGAGHQTPVGAAQQDVVQQRLLAQDLRKQRGAGRAIERADGRMAHEERRHGVEAREVLVEKRRGGGRKTAGLGFHFVGPFQAGLIAGPHHGDRDEQHQDERCHADLPENGLRAEKLQRLPRNSSAEGGGRRRPLRRILSRAARSCRSARRACPPAPGRNSCA